MMRTSPFTAAISPNRYSTPCTRPSHHHELRQEEDIQDGVVGVGGLLMRHEARDMDETYDSVDDEYY
jgi:hypothetical protein